MKYVIIFLIFFVFFIVEYFLLSKCKKEFLIYLYRYILINSVLIIIGFMLYNKINNILIFTILGLVKIVLDKCIVFKKLSFKVTDWEKYYNKKPLKIVEKKRKVNINYILDVLKQHGFTGGKIIEYGGGNSRVAEAISNEFNIKKFTIVDNNEMGIKLLDQRNIKNLEKHCISIFDHKDEKDFDLTYSIGLIEHFQNKDLEDCINYHFKHIKKGGYVLFTFPVPTTKYKIIRTIYEIFNLWQFTDEVALKPEIVEKIASKNGTILYSSINKKLILPQGIMLIKR